MCIYLQIKPPCLFDLFFLFYLFVCFFTLKNHGNCVWKRLSTPFYNLVTKASISFWADLCNRGALQKHYVVHHFTWLLKSCNCRSMMPRWFLIFKVTTHHIRISRDVNDVIHKCYKIENYELNVESQFLFWLKNSVSYYNRYRSYLWRVLGIGGYWLWSVS